MYKKKESFTTSASEEWVPWPIVWSAIWVGALASIAAATVLGLLGASLGATGIENVKDFSTWKTVSLIDTTAAVFGAFLAFVIGGWVTGKIAGIRRSEPAILHAVISWLVALPLLLAFLAIGAGKSFGGWYGGIIGNSRFIAGVGVTLSPEAVRHMAIAAETAILLGLIGSVIGGWMACGEPMSLTHYRTRGKALPRNSA